MADDDTESSEQCLLYSFSHLHSSMVPGPFDSDAVT